MNSKKWSSNQIFHLYSGNNIKTLSISSLFLLISMVLFFSCNKEDPFLVCNSKKCSYSSSVKGFLEIESDNVKKIKKIMPDGLKDFENFGSGRTLLAYDHLRNISLLRSMNEEGYSIEIIDNKENRKIKTIKLPEHVSAIKSSCFDENGKIWLLHIQEKKDTPRRFILSKSDQKYLKWENYMIREESDESWLKRIFTLGSPVERPVDITCEKDQVFITSHQFFQDIMQINIYRFDQQKRKLRYMTGFFPVDEKGKVTSHYFAKDSTLVVFQNRKLFTVKENNFPEIVIFNESGELFFSENEAELLMFFIPEKTDEGKKHGRLMTRTISDNK
jgi:hypothetical protein